MVEDLPAPFGPRNPNASVRGTCRSMPLTASTDPPPFTGNDLVRPDALIIRSAARTGAGAALPAAPPSERPVGEAVVTVREVTGGARQRSVFSSPAARLDDRDGDGPLSIDSDW